jgi:hypothetical protein
VHGHCQALGDKQKAKAMSRLQALASGDDRDSPQEKARRRQLRYDERQIRLKEALVGIAKERLRCPGSGVMSRRTFEEIAILLLQRGR